MIQYILGDTMEKRAEKNKEKQETIEEEEKREKRKKRAKIIMITLLISFAIFSISYFYITEIATKKLIVKEVVLTDEELPESFNGKKIVHFSDLHYGSTFFLGELKELIKVVNKRKPDLIFFTGDLIDEKYDLSTKEAEQITKELKKLKATIGKYAIFGEEDIERFQTIMNQSNFSILNNEYDLVYNNDTHPILIIGLGSLTTDRNIDHSFRYFKEENHNSNIYTITLLHEADSIDEIKSTYKTNLALAGHSHNGGIRLPFIGGITKMDGSTTYYEEHYTINKTQLYISSGLGTSNYNIRIGNHPSIYFFRLRK